MSRRTRRHNAPLVIAVGAAGALLLCAPPASAHVRVIGDVIPGHSATLKFRVPSELLDATTVRLAVDVPAGLSVPAVPSLDGWKTQRGPGPGGHGIRLLWTARLGHAIEPGVSQIFPVRVGPLPNTRSLMFNTEQTYSNGTVSAWNQPKTGAKEPEFPAPVLLVNPAAPAADPAPKTAPPKTKPPKAASLGVSAAPTVAVGPAARDGAESADHSNTPWVLAGGGLMAAILLAGGVLLGRKSLRANTAHD